MLLNRRSAPISRACVQSKPFTREPDPVVPTVDVWQLMGNDPRPIRAPLGRRRRRTRRATPPNPGTSDLPPLRPMGGPQLPGEAAVSLAAAHCSYASGARSLILVCRRRGLYQASIHSKIACDSWTFVSHRWVSRSSRCIVDQNDSIIVLSTEATRPIEPGSPAWCSRCPNAQEVYCPGCMTDRARPRSPSPTRHLQGIDDQVGTHVVVEQPSKCSPNGKSARPSPGPSNEPFSSWTKTFTDPRLCAAIVDRLTFAGQIIETGSSSYRLAHARNARPAS